jgi:hypothetical protein
MFYSEVFKQAFFNLRTPNNRLPHRFALRNDASNQRTLTTHNRQLKTHNRKPRTVLSRKARKEERKARKK